LKRLSKKWTKRSHHERRNVYRTDHLTTLARALRLIKRSKSQSDLRCLIHLRISQMEYLHVATGTQVLLVSIHTRLPMLNRQRGQHRSYLDLLHGKYLLRPEVTIATHRSRQTKQKKPGLANLEPQHQRNHLCRWPGA
jgi:hypothetical protein